MATNITVGAYTKITENKIELAQAYGINAKDYNTTYATRRVREAMATSAYLCGDFDFSLASVLEARWTNCPSIFRRMRMSGLNEDNIIKLIKQNIFGENPNNINVILDSESLVQCLGFTKSQIEAYYQCFDVKLDQANQTALPCTSGSYQDTKDDDIEEFSKCIDKMDNLVSHGTFYEYGKILEEPLAEWLLKFKKNAKIFNIDNEVAIMFLSALAPEPVNEYITELQDRHEDASLEFVLQKIRDSHLLRGEIVAATMTLLTKKFNLNMDPSDFVQEIAAAARIREPSIDEEFIILLIYSLLPEDLKIRLISDLTIKTLDTLTGEIMHYKSEKLSSSRFSPSTPNNQHQGINENHADNSQQSTDQRNRRNRRQRRSRISSDCEQRNY